MGGEREPRTEATYDLVISDARLRGREGRWSIGIEGDRISALERDPLSGREALDAAGRLVTESFVDPHLHLCKVYTLEMAGEDALRAYGSRGMGEAMTAVELASAVKDRYQEDWIYLNARRAILAGLRHGVTQVLAFADTDTRARLEGVKGVLRVREALGDVVRIRVVAFPQDGVVRDPGAADYVREALELGADVVGGIPWIEYTDADARRHVEQMTDLAVEFDRDVAMLVDDAGDPGLRTTEMLAVAAIERGLEGRVVACHARAMGLYPEPYFRRLLGLVRRAGMAFVTDPHTGALSLRALELADAGVPVALGQDDMVDAFYPYGRHNLLEVAFLASHLLGASTLDRMELLFEMVTTRAAEVLGLGGHRLEEGGRADLVVLEGTDVREVLTSHRAPRWVVSGGRVVAETEEVGGLRGVAEGEDA